ncbi:hypothetical protein RBB50_007437 [Rhinocladiella similis]
MAMLKSNNRDRAPGEDEWERIKPILERLYIQDNLPLERMADVLSTEHDFNAKLNMYKTRLRKWKIRKNFKRQELALAATTAEPFWKAGLDPPPIALNNRMVPMDRVKRHFGHRIRRPRLTTSRKMKRKLEKASPRSGDAQAVFSAERQRQAVPRVWLQQSPEMHVLETALIETNNYFSWRLKLDDSHFVRQDSLGRADTIQLTRPFQLYNHLNHTIYALWSSDSHLARHHISQLMGLAPKVFSEQHPKLLLAILRLGLKSGSDLEGQVHSAVVTYLFRLANRLLTAHHPISKVLELRRLNADVSPCFYKLMSLLRDITANKHGQYSDLVLDIEEHLACISSDELNADFTTRFCQDLLTRYVDVLGIGHWRCRRLSLRLARHFYSENQLSEAERLCQRLLSADASDNENHSIPDWTTLSAMNLQANLRRDAGDYRNAAHWFRRAHIGFVQVYGLDDSRTHLSLCEAENMELEHDRSQGLISFEQPGNKDAETTAHTVQNLVNDLEAGVLRLTLNDATESSQLVDADLLTFINVDVIVHQECGTAEGPSNPDVYRQTSLRQSELMSVPIPSYTRFVDRGDRCDFDPEQQMFHKQPARADAQNYHHQGSLDRSSGDLTMTSSDRDLDPYHNSYSTPLEGVDVAAASSDRWLESLPPLPEDKRVDYNTDALTGMGKADAPPLILDSEWSRDPNTDGLFVWDSFIDWSAMEQQDFLADYEASWV